MRILIVKLGAIGDVLRTTSILEGLRAKHKNVQIDWLVAASSKEVLLNNPYINNLYTWQEKEKIKDIDLVINLEDEYEVAKFVKELSAKEVMGVYWVDDKIAYTPSAWFDMSAISKHGIEKANELKKKNSKTYQQHLMDLLGIKVGRYVFNLTEEEVEYGKQYVKNLGLDKNRPILGINTSAGRRWALKSLSIENTIELIKKINKGLNVQCLVLGGEEEKERNEIICKDTGAKNGGTHSLRNFASIINQCDVVLTSDSLAMHFAIALKKRLVVFFGPTSHTEIELYDQGVKVAPNMECLICYLKECERDPSCMGALSMDDLITAIKTEANKIYK